MVGQNFVKKEYQEIFMAELTNALEQKLISKQDDFEKYIKNRSDISNFYVMLLSIFAETVDELYEAVENEYYSNKVDYAVGRDLDDLGVLLNCPRPNGTKSAVNITFSLSERQEAEVTIPAGAIQCTSTNGLTFRSNEPLYFGVGETTKTITFLCTQKGLNHQTDANTIRTTDTDLSQWLTGTINVTNDKSSFGGSNTFTDEQYRTLLKNWILENQAGNLVAYQNFLDDIDGLESYNLVPLFDGAGTVQIILDCDDSPSIFNQVWEGLKPVTKNIDADIVLATPEKVVIDVYCVVDVNIDRTNPYSKIEMDEIKLKIESALNNYIRGGIRRSGNYYRGLTIGQDFIPFRAGMFITEEVSEAQNVVFNYPEEVISVSDNEIGVIGEINVEVK